MLLSQIVPVTAGEIRGKRYTNPFDSHIGISTENLTSGIDKCAITVTPQHTASNVQGGIHGGWIAAVLDSVGSGAAYSYQAGGLKDDEYGLTASLNIGFNAPVFAGQTYTCEGTIIERQGNNIKTKAALIDDKGTKVATAEALVKARRLNYKPTG